MASFGCVFYACFTRGLNAKRAIKLQIGSCPDQNNQDQIKRFINKLLQGNFRESEPPVFCNRENLTTNGKGVPAKVWSRSGIIKLRPVICHVSQRNLICLLANESVPHFVFFRCSWSDRISIARVSIVQRQEDSRQSTLRTYISGH